MISVCIPVYNYDVRLLIQDLSSQIQNHNLPVEIVIIDDFSRKEFKQINQSSCLQHNYTELDKNVGRAKIRNMFLEYTKYEYLLYLDCDCEIISKKFLLKYLDYISKNTDKIICGGRVYPKTKPNRSFLLRWKYGKYKESKVANQRNISPNKSFMTNNFLINRAIFNEIKFDEEIINYGHEDTLFGYLLNKKGFTIQHIENPVLNGDLETNQIYLKKTKIAIENLYNILTSKHTKPDFANEVKLLNTYIQFEKSRTKWLIWLLFKLTKNPIYFLLRRGFVSLLLFDFYKLGILITLSYRTRQSTS